MKLHVDQLFRNVTLERFLEVYFSEGFNNAVAPISGLKQRTLVEERIHADGSRDRRVHMKPAVALPATITKFVKQEQIAYDEVSRFDAAKREVTYRIESAAGERLTMRGTIRFVPDGTGVRRIIDSELGVKAPLGLGGMIERFIEGEMKKGYEKLGAFMQKYLDEHAQKPVA